MIGKFKSFIESNHLFNKSDRVLLTVSGGMDSMAMAELFSRAGYNFAIIHCNFKLRGREADLDEQLTETMAGRYEVDFFSRSFNTAEIAKDRGESIQMVARDLRYEYFHEVAEEQGFNYIATAHHLDDQIETFFINLMRGTGIAGLHGIRIKQGKIIRPMMFAQKQDIEAFVTENMLAYREDESNRSLKYTRNRIRHELMPAFLEMNPAFREEMTANIKRLAETEVVFKQYISKVKSDVRHKEGEVTAIDIQKLKALEPLQVFLYEFIMEYGFKKDDVGNIIQSLDGISGKKFLSPTHQLIIDRKNILITPIKKAFPGDEEYEIHRTTTSLKAPVNWAIEEHNADDYIIPKEDHIASLDLEKLTFPLRLRRWQKGDTFIPLGMKNHKKLSDFFIDNKFSLIQKENTWILCSGGDIVWIAGARIDDRFKVSSNTEKVYRIEAC